MIGIGGLMAVIGASTAPLRSGLKDAENAVKQSSDRMASNMSSFERNLNRVGETSKKVGSALTKYVTLPLAGIAAASFKMAMGFEASMSKIVGLVGVASDQVQEWSKDLLRMAPQLGKAPQELADAMFFITSAGNRGAQAMDLLEMSAKASVAGLGETKVIAHLASSAIAAYGSENLTAAQAIDTLVAAVREGKAEAADLAATMGQVLPVAAEVGVSFDQIGATQAAMTRTGTNAATAATQLKAILNTAIRPTQQAENALAGLNSSSENLRRIIQEDGLLAGLQHLKDITGGNASEVAEIIPNIRALTGFFDLMGKNAESTAKIFESVKNATGSLDDAFLAATETMEHTWNQAIEGSKAALTATGLIIKDSMLPALRVYSGGVARLTEWLLGLNDVQRRWVVILGGIATAIGPVLFLLGILITSVIPKLIIGIRATRTAFLRLNAVIAANPFGAALTAITLVAGALVLFRSRTNEAKKAQDDLHDSLKDVNDEIASQLLANLEVFDYVGSQDGIPKFRLSVERLTESLHTLRREELNAIKGVLEKELANATRAAANAMDEFSKATAESNMEAYRAALAGVNDELEKFVDNTTDATDGTERTKGIIATLTEEIDALTKQRLGATTLQDIAQLNDLIKETEERLRGIQNMSLASRDIVMPEPMDMRGTGTISMTVASSDLDAMSKARAILSAYNRELDQLPAKGWSASEAVSQIGHEMEVVSHTINRLLEAGMDPLSDRILELQERFHELAEEQWRLKDNIDMVNNALQRMLTDLLGAATETFTAIITGSVSFVEGMNQMIVMVGGMFKELGYLFLAQGIAAKAFGDSLSNPYTAIVAGLALIAAGAAVEAFVADPPTMARGGIVPQGFPNDTYPALLSSGETVIPAPHPLPQVTDIGAQQKAIDVHVYGQLTGEDTYLSTDRFNKRKELVE